MQVAKMSQIKVKAIYVNYVNKLVMCLPMDDTHFITKLSSQQLLPGDTESKIKALPTQADKASYFLSHVIKPALDIDDISGFNKFLSVMQECEYNHVQKLSNEIRDEINITKLEAGNIRTIYTVHVHIATHIEKLQSCNNLVTRSFTRSSVVTTF